MDTHESRNGRKKDKMRPKIKNLTKCSGVSVSTWAVLGLISSISISKVDCANESTSQKRIGTRGVLRANNEMSGTIPPPHRRAEPHVRAAIATVEEETIFHPERSAWGGRHPDSKPIDYGGTHPFEVYQNRERRLHDESLRERKLQDEVNNGDDSDFFKPMRIKFYTEQLFIDAEDKNTTQALEKAYFIQDYILEQTRDFWQNALSVVPVQGPLFIDTYSLYAGAYCGDTQFTRVPNEHIASGIEETDLMLYVSASDSPLFCGGNTLAVAVACNVDQWDRPTAGAVNFCFDGIDDLNGENPPLSMIQDSVDVAIHEAGHVLGMSSNSFRYFRDKLTGAPLTERPILPQSVTCVDGQTRETYIPSTAILKFETNSNTGKIAALVVTETVRAVVRNQFNCGDLEGAQLENQPTGSSSCFGDHWDEKLFYPEALSGIVAPTSNIMSPLTLALFEDSGWYKGNYSMTLMSPWGLGAGCDFVRGNCVENGVVPSHGKGYFCAQRNTFGCSFGNSHKMACTIIDFSNHETSIPAAYQYFPSTPSYGGPVQADFCPIFSTSYAISLLDTTTPDDLDCTNPANNKLINSVSNLHWEQYGTDSRCFETDLGKPICYQRQCIKDENIVKVFVRDTWHTCSYDFEVIKPYESILGLLDFTFTCPRLSAVCPDLFCPANCSGRGICEFKVDESNPKSPPRASCKCFDESDTSPGCSSALLLKGDWIDTSDDLQGQIRSGRFFDPFVKVFLDDPENWTKKSWTWAIGMMILVGVLFLCFCSSFFPTKKKKKRSGHKRTQQTRTRAQRVSSPVPRKGYYSPRNNTPKPSAPPC
mmetsp:Transcript_324/g.780  ORF Transcript_324/g.780 Transcript_324/m.780 type:complete len:819 (+) Transcript_324:199-2655(+)